jgi:hypothetical protein
MRSRWMRVRDSPLATKRRARSGIWLRESAAVTHPGLCHSEPLLRLRSGHAPGAGNPRDGTTQRMSFVTTALSWTVAGRRLRPKAEGSLPPEGHRRQAHPRSARIPQRRRLRSTPPRSDPTQARPEGAGSPSLFHCSLDDLIERAGRCRVQCGPPSPTLPRIVVTTPSASAR